MFQMRGGRTAWVWWYGFNVSGHSSGGSVFVECEAVEYSPQRQAEGFGGGKAEREPCGLACSVV